MKRVHHIALLVSDLQAAALTYSRILGLPPDFYHVDEQAVRIAMFQLENIKIELVCPYPSNDSLNKRLKSRGEGFHHLALESNDIKLDLDNLQKLNFDSIPLLSEAGAQSSKVSFLKPKHTHGTLIELVQLPKN